MVGGFLGNEGVIAPCHVRAGVGVLLFHRNLVYHSLNGGELMYTAKGHEHRARTDGGVKALTKTATGADIEVTCQSSHAACKVSGNVLSIRLCLGQRDIHVLLCTVGIQEFTGKVNDDVAVPGHSQSLLRLDACYAGCFKVLGKRQLAEAISILGSNHNSHSLLAFADGKLGAVQALVLLGHGVQINIQTVGQLADGNRNTACAKVVAALDQTGGLGITEQSLQLSFLGCVTLLHLCTTAFQRGQRVGLGGAGSTATAVTAGASAQQDDDILGIGHLAAYVLGRSGRDNRADLHALCGVAVMVKLVYLAGCKTDLVTVGGITCSCGGDQLLLRQLTGQSFGKCTGGICAAGDTHGGINVGASRQRVTDRTANAGGRAAKGLYFGGVIVRFVLEQQEPGLVAILGLDRDLDGASIDLLGLVDAGQLAVCLEIARADGGNVHQRHGLVGATQLLSHVQIDLARSLQLLVLDGNLADLGQERGVTAVVRPIGIDHADLGDGGIALFADKIVAAERKVVHIHCKAVGLDELCQRICVHLAKAGQGFHGGGNIKLCGKRFGLVQGRLAALHGIDHMLLDGRDLRLGQFTVQKIDLCGAHGGAVAARNDLHALCRAVCSLVILAGQKFHGKDLGTVNVDLIGHVVQLRLGQHGLGGILKQLCGGIFHVIAVDHAHTGERVNTKEGIDLAAKGGGLVVKSLLLFYVNSENHASSLLLVRRQRTLTNVAAHVGILKLNLFCNLVCMCNSIGKTILYRNCAQHSAACGDKRAILHLGACDKDIFILTRLGQAHGITRAILLRITARCNHHAACVTVSKLNLGLCKRAVRSCLHDGQEVTLQKRQDDLRFGIAKSAVIFNDLGAVRGQHQTEVQATLEGSALGIHSRHGRQEDLLHANPCHVLGVIGVGRNRAHTARVQTLVAVQCALVVHGGNHGLDALAVGKRQHGHLGAGQEFLNHHAAAALAKRLILHHREDGLLGLFPALCNDHALAQCQTVGLDDRGDGRGFDIRQRGIHILKHLVCRGGDAVFLHQILGEHLTALDDGCLGLRAKARDADLVQSVDTAKHQRIVRCDHGKIDGVFLGKRHDAVKILCTHGHAHSVTRHAAVTGQRVNDLNLGVLS